MACGIQEMTDSPVQAMHHKWHNLKGAKCWKTATQRSMYYETWSPWSDASLGLKKSKIFNNFFEIPTYSSTGQEEVGCYYLEFWCECDSRSEIFTIDRNKQLFMDIYINTLKISILGSAVQNVSELIVIKWNFKCTHQSHYKTMLN